MRKIYYVPQGQDINEYRDIWENHTSEIHNSISKNIEEKIKQTKEQGGKIITGKSGLSVFVRSTIFTDSFDIALASSVKVVLLFVMGSSL